MIRLRRLRSRLRSFGRRRRAARLAIGYSALVVAVTWLLVAVFLADWLLDMNPSQRIVVMGLACAGLAWAFVRLTRPWLGPRETLVDLALLVQGQQHIDSDLVAALQFERPEAANWGSVEMERAVIEHVGRAARRLEIMLGVSTRQLLLRLAILAVTLAVVGMAAWQYGEYAAVFFNRLALGSDRYRTETTILSVSINDQPVDLLAPDAEEIKCAYGQPVRFEAICSGRLPPVGRAVLQAGGAPQKDIILQPRQKREAASPHPNPLPEGEGTQVYAGQSDRLFETAACRIVVGDDRTRSIRLAVTPPPVVDVFLEVTPPSYAAGPAPTETVSGLRQLAVVEGSRVRLRITADKRLKEATLTLKPLHEEPAATEAKPYLLRRLEGQPSDDAKVRDAWALEPAGTPLEKLVEPVRYTLRVKDADGLELERPIEGGIGIYVDQPPQVFASARVQLVVPRARPTIQFQAADDYGLAQIKVLCEVAHADGTPGEKGEVTVYTLSPDEPPRKNIQDSYRLALAPLKAVKGDKIKVVLQAVDHRGGPGRPQGKAALSDPIEFQVTDLDGILAAILEADRESARQYKTMIDDQIDVGGGR